MTINQPECCSQCCHIWHYNGSMVCTSPFFPLKVQTLDISSFRVNPDEIPDWCPYTSINKAISLMPKEKQRALEKIIDGINTIFEMGAMHLQEQMKEETL